MVTRSDTKSAPSPETPRRKSKKGRNEFGISLGDAREELKIEIEDAVDFLFSEFEDDWTQAERYYAGNTDIPDEVGRSTIVKTEVRDAIRHLMPSVMRVFLQARKIVEYIPSGVMSAELAEQQSIYMTQLFWQQGGYKMLYDSSMESMTKKVGPVKAYWEENPRPEYMEFRGITEEDLNEITDYEDMELVDVSPREGELDGIQLYDVDAYMYYTNGKVRMEAFPIYEFFISRNANGIADAFVHGHRREVRVSEAMEMGLEYDDWGSLDSEDPEQHEFAQQSKERRGYLKRDDNEQQQDDLLNRKFLLTECYCEYDLEGTGNAQQYVFYFGGSSYKYLHHQKVDDYCIELVEVDPVPFAAIGRSIADLTIKEQDTMTSLLRIIIDNGHMANNPRFAADPNTTDFDDLMNGAIGAPVKSRNPQAINVIDIPFTAQGLLPVLGYLEQDAENKVGITKAAQGLDPDALQSTDKEAVRNTIALAQGQVELIVRNIIETGIVPLFKRLLKLSMTHMDRVQVMKYKGVVVPVFPAAFNPDLVAEPNIGLGTTQPEAKLAALQFVLAKQEQVIGTYGLDNPFTSLSHIYNTIEEMVELSGLYNVGRYFKMVTPEIEQQLAKQRAEAAKAAQEAGDDKTPMDPSKALMAIESGKSQVRMSEIMARDAQVQNDQRLDALKFQEDSDYKRDKMVQDKHLRMLEIQEGGRKARADSAIKREQQRNTTRQQRQAATLGKEKMNGSSPVSGSETRS